MYFVRRKGQIRGPLTLEKLQSLRDEDRLRMRDEIAESADGPWSRLADIYDELLGTGPAEDHDAAALDDDFAAPQRPRRRSSAARSATAASKAAPRPTLFGGRVKPWQVIAAAGGLACLLVLATAVGVLLSPLVSADRDDEEAAAGDDSSPTRPARPAAPRQPPPPAAATTSEAAEPMPQDSATPAAPPPAATADAAPGDIAAIDHEAGIKATLGSYYSAGNWQDRYRTVLADEEVKKLMRSMYDDVDWVSVQWSVARMPGRDELAAAARGGQRVRIDTITNGNPHAIYVTFADGGWRIDWLQSLNGLWLTK